MGFSINGGTQNRWFTMGNPIKMDDLGVPLISGNLYSVDIGVLHTTPSLWIGLQSMIGTALHKPVEPVKHVYNVTYILGRPPSKTVMISKAGFWPCSSGQVGY